MLTIPYSTTDVGNLNLTANITSPCAFTPAQVTTQVRVNEQGPTVWPITSRTCPAPGQKPVFRFGVRNPSDQPQTYSVMARATTQFGGDHTPLLNDNQAEPGVYRFSDITVEKGQTQQIDVTCETFGFCLTGSESRVDLAVAPAAGSAEQFDSVLASASVTLRDPNVSCSAPEDWWFLVSPLAWALMIGAPMALVLGSAVWHFRPRSVTTAGPDGSTAFVETNRSGKKGAVNKGDWQESHGDDAVNIRKP